MRVVWNYAKNRPVENFFCDTSCKGVWQKAQREALGYTKEWLIDQYHVQKKGAAQIGREIGRDPKRVWEWIRDYGLETRPRGNEYGRRIKKGDPSPFRGRKHTESAKQKMREARIKEGRWPCYKDGVHWMHHPDHAGQKPASWKGGVTPERQALYSSQEWTDAVKAVWARDNATCQRCGKHHNTTKSRGTFHIHHIISFMHKEYRSDVDNLVLLCKDCHRWVHSKANVKKRFYQGDKK